MVYSLGLIVYADLEATEEVSSSVVKVAAAPEDSTIASLHEGGSC